MTPSEFLKVLTALSEIRSALLSLAARVERLETERCVGSSITTLQAVPC